MVMIPEKPLVGNVAAVSVGIINDDLLLDLNYMEDSTADVDMNIVMLNDEFVEIQGTAEGSTFKRKMLDEMLKQSENPDVQEQHFPVNNRTQIPTYPIPLIFSCACDGRFILKFYGINVLLSKRRSYAT